MACDPHGNLKQDYVESIQILRSYRQSPHTDKEETYEKVTSLLCELLKHRQAIHAVYRKLPLILGGEQSVSSDEPVHSINRYMDELEPVSYTHLDVYKRQEAAESTDGVYNTIRKIAERD